MPQRPFDPATIPHSGRYRLLLGLSAGFALLPVAGFLFALVSMIRATHSRPPGHGDISFAASPTGEAVVFNAAGQGGRDLFRLDRATSRVTRVAATPDYEVDPAFAPDGKSIVYAAGQPGDGADHLFVRALDGTPARQLTRGDANDASPTFSPDGTRIAFTRDRSPNRGGLAATWDAGGVLCVIAADGSGLRELTRDDEPAIGPRFSPDGSTILFQGKAGTTLIAADGGQPPRTIAGPGWTGAVFAPDGQSLAYASGRFAGDQRISVARADGTGSRLVTRQGMGGGAPPGGGCTRPAFTADGTRILFLAELWPDGPTGAPKQALWEIDLEGDHPREVADPRLFDDPLEWRPSPPSPPGK